MKLYSKKSEGENVKLKLVGITIYKQERRGNFCVKKYLGGIVKVKRSRHEKKIYFCGVQCFRKEDSFLKLQDVLYKRINDVFYNSQVLTQVPLVHSYFTKFKRINEGRDVVLFACGPTSNYYNAISNAVHVGVNGAVRVFDKLDYVFCQEMYLKDTTLNNDIDNYKGNNCIKFYGILPMNSIIGRPKQNVWDIIQPNHIYKTQNVYEYLLEDVTTSKWAINLEREAFGDFYGTVYSAIQFIMYTNPKRVFLVGCDCSQGYAYGSDILFKYGNYIKRWKMFKHFANRFYPDTEIISINPVGLKGMFKDVYTQSYLDANPELKKELGNNIEILEEECV